MEIPPEVQRDLYFDVIKPILKPALVGFVGIALLFFVTEAVSHGLKILGPIIREFRLKWSAEAVNAYGTTLVFLLAFALYVNFDVPLFGGSSEPLPVYVGLVLIFAFCIFILVQRSTRLKNMGCDADTPRLSRRAKGYRRCFPSTW